MDMTPPQAPPAISTHQNQAAIDTVSRLASIQAWLANEQAGLPQVGISPTEADKAIFFTQLNTWWHAPAAIAPGTAAMPRGNALAMQMAATMREMGTLLDSDGTIDARASVLVSELTRSIGGIPSHLRASELMIGDTAYAGALVLQRKGVDDLALLFLPHGGWQVFNSLDALHETTEQRLRRQLVAQPELTGIVASDMERAIGDSFVSSRDAGPDAFDVMVNRVAALQEQRTRDVWDTFGLGMINGTQLADRVRDALNLHDHLDIHAVLLARDAQLSEALAQERLAALPHNVRAAWMQARNAYREALVSATRERADANIKELVSLEQFATDALAPTLAAAGITDDPAGIAVTVTLAPTDAAALLAAVVSGRPAHTVSLIDLARVNIGAADTSRMTATRMDGGELSAPLTHAMLRGMIREANVGKRYLSYLDNALVAGAAGRASRGIAIRLQQARMQFELEDSRLSIYRADEPRAFPHADLGTGYAMAKAVVNAPDASMRARVDGHEVVARQLVYRGAALTDILEIGVRSQQSSSRVVYYTPDAPDGIAFREFSSRGEAARRFLYNAAFETYLLDHLPAQFAHEPTAGARRFKVSSAATLATWALSQDGGGAYTRMEERIADRETSGNVLHAMYAASVARLRLDVQSETRTQEAADTETVTAALTSVMKPGTRPAAVAADLALESVRAAAGIMPSLQRMADNVRAGDHGQAFVDFTEAYHSSLNVIGPHPARLASLAGLSVRAGRQAGTRVATRRAVAAPGTIFEPSYIAAGVRASQATSVRHGVFHIGGGTYIRQNGNMYGVRFDADALAHDGKGIWRLARPSPLDARFTGPAIEPTSANTWQYTRQIGLRGGLRGATPRPGELTDDLSWWPAGRFAMLTMDQRTAMAGRINRATGQAGVENGLYIWAVRRGISQQPGRAGAIDILSAPHRRLMLDALAYAERQPAVVARPPMPTFIRPAAPRPAASAAGSANGPASVTTARQQPVIMRSTREIMQLEPADWPDTMWVYLERADVLARTGVHDMRLPQARLAQGRVQGVAGLTLPPATRLADIPGAPAQASTSTASLGSAAGGWVRINLRQVRERAQADVLPLFHLFVPRGAGRTGLIIVPRATFGDPTALRDVWLQAGEFELGLWRPAG